MGQPVKLSDRLILDARMVSELTERSIAGQIEFWASLGKAVESLLRTDQVLELKRRGSAKSLSQCLDEIHTKKGRERLAEVLQKRPFPHFEAAADKPGYLVKIDEDGTRTVGRFRNREFIPIRS